MKEFKTIGIENIYEEDVTTIPEDHSIVECVCCKVKLIVPDEEISDDIVFLCETCDKEIMKMNIEEELNNIKNGDSEENNVINAALGN